jgi:hypothetical protein
MSYCQIITFKDGIPDKRQEFKNSWGGTAFIWDVLFDKYLKKNQYDTWLGNAGKADSPLWSIAANPKLSLVERAVHISTFDRAIVKQENLQRIANDFRAFRKLFPNDGRICHLNEWAGFIELNLNVEAIGFYGTSVAENLWYIYPSEIEVNSDNKKIDAVVRTLGNEEEEPIPYNIRTMSLHFEVYEYLKELTEEEQDGKH